MSIIPKFIFLYTLKKSKSILTNWQIAENIRLKNVHLCFLFKKYCDFHNPITFNTLQKIGKKKKKLSLYWKKVRTKLLVFEHSRRNETENDTTDLRSFSKISCACLNRVLIKLLITIYVILPQLKCVADHSGAYML